MIETPKTNVQSIYINNPIEIFYLFINKNKQHWSLLQRSLKNRVELIETCSLSHKISFFLPPWKVGKFVADKEAAPEGARRHGVEIELRRPFGVAVVTIGNWTRIAAALVVHVHAHTSRGEMTEAPPLPTRLSSRQRAETQFCRGVQPEFTADQAVSWNQ